MFKKITIGLAIGLLGAVAVQSAVAADAFPTKPITAYIGFRAGGGTDTIGRVVAHVMGEKLGQQINVVNKTGASGSIAATTVMRAKPDGYSILLSSTSALTSAPLLNKKIKYTIDDFRHVGIIATYQNGIVAPNDKPYNTIKEFVEYARKNPGAKYVSVSSISRMLMQHIVDKEKIKVSFVPAKGGSAIINLFAGNQVDLGYSGGFHQKHPDKMKLLAAATMERHAANPDVPTLLEAGYPLALAASIAVSVPKDTPADIVAKIEAAVKAAVEHPDVRKIAGKYRYPLDYQNAATTTETLAQHYKFYQDLISNAKAN